MTSNAVHASVKGDGSSDILVELVTLEHPTFDAPIYVCNVAEEGYRLTSQEREFIAYPFALSWPENGPDNPFSGAKFTINNVVAQDGTDEPLLLAALRGLPDWARVRFELVRVIAPDVIEQRTTRLRLAGLSYAETTITGELRMPSFVDRRAGGSFSPDTYRHLRAG
ncbi:hypothetical protein OVA11_19015 [Caulobacter sp. SL161]|uniref:hypothetical protein n=1 Tax=Caulobacter TaxID=75 RepID=UPI0015E78903|nr:MULTISPECIES: hypothetical protein [Caulobacter]MCY1649069.1 hypothetical protein [Caulobacter sp. SL161]